MQELCPPDPSDWIISPCFPTQHPKQLNPEVLLFVQPPDQSGSNNRGCTVEIHCTNACLHPNAFPVGNNVVYTQTVAAW